VPPVGFGPRRLAADVAELPVSYGRIDVFPEHVEEFFVVHLLRIVDDLHDLRVTCGPRGHLLHSWDFSWVPPMYPEVVEMTPGKAS